MGILSKILPDKKIPALEKNISDVAAPVATDCPQPCPAGHSNHIHYWRDTYGFWRCTACNPPASMAMVKEEFLFGRDGDDLTNPLAQAAAAEDFELASGFQIMAIQRPNGGGMIFAPSTTQAVRRAIVDNLAWFERSDARVEKPQRLMRAGFGKK